MERAVKMPPDKIALHVKTQRKQFSWVHAVSDYASATTARPAELVITKALTKGRDSTPEHESASPGKWASWYSFYEPRSGPVA